MAVSVEVSVVAKVEREREQRIAIETKARFKTGKQRAIKGIRDMASGRERRNRRAGFSKSKIGIMVGADNLESM